MSRVFVAEERALGRKVVIKVLAPELAAGVSAERFAREIRLTAQLQHPQIVPVHSAGETGGLPYYAMPFVEGESLRDQLARTGPLSVAEAVSILRDVAKALDFAHSHGVVHRDIKPGNVLISGHSATVADFGIGKAISVSSTRGDATLTQRGTAVGTPAYMAPEQATGDDRADHRVDIYSFGALAYEVLTGAPPFSGMTSHDLVVALLTQTPVSVGARRPEAPAPLVALVMRCLEKEPAARPQSARELGVSLDALFTPVTPVAHAAWPGSRRTRLVGVAVAATALLLLLLAVGYAVWRLRPSGGVAADARALRSVAVLPFTNVAGDTATDYFSDGITGELIGALARVPGLRVAPRASSFAFKGKDVVLGDIGRRLNVAAVVEGTVTRLGAIVRVTAELVNTQNDSVLWAGSFEGGLQNVTAVQDSIARAVVGSLHVGVGGRPAVAAHARAPRDTAAYLLYLKGRFLWNQRTPSTLRKAIVLLEQAIALDSTYAQAYAGLASAYSLLPGFGDEAPSDAMPRAKAAAGHALALDSTFAEPYVALGFISTFYDWDWAAAERYFAKAIAIEPNDAPAHLFRTWVFTATGRMDEAVASVRRARELDPLSQIINTRVGTALYYMHRYGEAAAELHKAIDLDSTNMLARYQLARTLVQLRRFDEALSVVPPSVDATTGWEGGGVVYNYAMAGRRSEALVLRKRLEHLAKSRYIGPDAIVCADIALGDTASALNWLDIAVRGRSFYLVFLQVEPMFDGLRNQPRFQAALRTVGVRAPTLAGRPVRQATPRG